MKRAIRKIKMLFTRIKWFFQRGIKGYCDYDLWSIREWFVSIFPKMLREFGDDLHSVPCGLSGNEWRDMLNRMAVVLERTDEDYWFEKIHNGEIDTNEVSFIDEMVNNKKMFMEMFSTYFFDLWD